VAALRPPHVVVAGFNALQHRWQHDGCDVYICTRHLVLRNHEEWPHPVIQTGNVAIDLSVPLLDHVY
jgi:hypothetical protein